MELGELSNYLVKNNYSVDKIDEFSIGLYRHKNIFSKKTNLGELACEPTMEYGKQKICIDDGLSHSIPKQYVNALANLYKTTGGKFENEKFNSLKSRNFWPRKVKSLFSKDKSLENFVLAISYF